MSATIADLGIDHAPWRYALAFDYSPAMVQALKDNIPSRQRKWMPERKEWWFKPGMLAGVRALAERHCGRVQYVTEGDAGEDVLVPAQDATAYRTLHLLPSAPPELVRAAYKVLAKRCHPDAGGSTQAMQRINAAYAVLARSQEEA
jgi:hypothetical protein